jgi:hypothetical protein
MKNCYPHSGTSSLIAKIPWSFLIRSESESSFLGLPVINLGFRQSNRQRATNVVDILKPSKGDLEQAIERHFGQKFARSELYGNGRAGITAALVIASWRPRPKGIHKI